MADKNDLPVNSDDLFERIINGEDIVEEVQTKRGTFKIKFPLGSDFIEITKRKYEYLGDLDPKKLSREEMIDIDAYATLDVVIVDSPEWWKKLKNSSKCPDPSIIVELYRGFLRHYGEIQKLIHGGGDNESNRKPKSKKPTEDVGIEPFSGITL